MRSERAQAETFGRGSQSVCFALLIVHEVARSKWSGQLGVIDLAGDGGDSTVECLLQPLSEGLFEGVVFRSALFPARVLPGREPLIRDEDDGFQRRAAGVFAFEIGILSRRERDVDHGKGSRWIVAEAREVGVVIP